MAGLTALIAVRDAGQVRPGTRILINGAAGGIGSMAVQIAETFGADVTGMQHVQRRLVRSLGADRVIDCTRTSYTEGDRHPRQRMNHAPADGARAGRGGVFIPNSVGTDGGLLGGPPRVARASRLHADHHLGSHHVVTRVHQLRSYVHGHSRAPPRGLTTGSTAMIVTTTSLTRAAGVAAAAAGAIFIGVQINHPQLDVASIATTEVVTRNILKVLMAALAVAGITGIYLSHVRRNGVVGLVGYLLLATGYLVIMSTSLVAASVLPSIAGTDPAFVRDFLAVSTGGTATGDLGLLGVVLRVQDLCYLAGGLVLGVALYRAGVLARWATVLLAVGGVVTIALSMMPDAFYRLLAFPNGIAMIGLGYSLWSTARTATTTELSAADGLPVAIAGAE